MMSGNKDKKRTGPGVSDPQGPAGEAGIVPAPSSSSSDVGLPSEFRESSGGELAISLMARGLAKSLSAAKQRRSGAGGSPGQRSSPEVDAGMEACPEPSTLGPSRVMAAAGTRCLSVPDRCPLRRRGGCHPGGPHRGGFVWRCVGE